MVPPMTVSPSPASPGTDSPVIMLRSMAVWPNCTSPSAAMVSPGRTTNMSPGRSRLAGTRRSVPSGLEQAHVPGRGRRQVAHGLAGDAPGPCLVQPAGQQERGDRGGGLQVDAAAGVVDQPLPQRPALAAAVEHEHGVDRPAARRDDAQRHQRVHRGGAVPGVLQRGPVERPGAPQGHRRRAGDEQPLPAGEPQRRDQRRASATGRSAGRRRSARRSAAGSGRRSACRPGRPVRPVRPGRPAEPAHPGRRRRGPLAGGRRGERAEYPARSTAATSSATGIAAGAVTRAVAVA